MGSSRDAARRFVSLVAGGAMLLVCVASVAAQAEPQPEPVPAADTAAAPQPEDALAQPAPESEEAEPAPPLSPEEAAGFEALESAQKSADVTGFRERELRAELEVAKREEQEASTLWPWVTTIVGWGTVLAGTAIGAGQVIACDEESCTQASWPSWLVIGGSLVGSLGTLWVVLEDRDIAELKIRRQRIERLLEEGRSGRASARVNGTPLALAWSGSFDL